MKTKRKALLACLAALLLLCSCSQATGYVSSRHTPVQFDGHRVYGGIGGTQITSLSVDNGVYGPLCSDPSCSHGMNDPSCGAYVGWGFGAMTMDGEGNLLAAARSDDNPSAYNVISVSPSSGERRYVLHEYPNSIGAMMVVGSRLYFLSQMQDEQKEDGEQSGANHVCTVSLKGGRVKALDLPDNDWYFEGADTETLYLLGAYDRTLVAVSLNGKTSEPLSDGNTREVLHTFGSGESTDCYITGDFLYLFDSRESVEVTAPWDGDEMIPEEERTNTYSLYSVAKVDRGTGEVLARTEMKVQTTAWGYLSEDGQTLYLPHFEPRAAGVYERNDGSLNYPVVRNPGVDVFDTADMRLVETVRAEGFNIQAIAYADEDKIVFYGGTYDPRLNWEMGWISRQTGKITMATAQWLN